MCHIYNLISLKINIAEEYRLEMLGRIRLETMLGVIELKSEEVWKYGSIYRVEQ